MLAEPYVYRFNDMEAVMSMMMAVSWLAATLRPVDIRVHNFDVLK